MDALERRDSEDQWRYLTKLKAQQKKELSLNDPGDYLIHSTEFKLDPLPLGQYAILISTHTDFRFEDQLSILQMTNVSQLAYVDRTSSNGKKEFIVMDRKTGEPLEGVLAEFYRRYYNARRQKHVLTKVGEARSDENGFIRPKVSGRNYWNIKLIKGDDVYVGNDTYRNFNNNSRKTTTRSTQFFLDRSIYRPGQTVYFKGILIEKSSDSRQPKVLSNQTATIRLLDVNRQEVAKLDLKSNEYGSINGSFKLPQGGLLGGMTLSSNVGNNSAYFSVEEYKRPKFEVAIENLEKAYSLGDKIEVKANANAYAGFSVTNAKVRYEVIRRVSYPWRPWWYGRLPNDGKEIVMTFGETQTDDNGEVIISFDALPDPSVSKENQPEFAYEVSIDVIDITGETHSGKKTFRLAYQGLRVALNHGSELDVKNNPIVNISTSDLNGNTIGAEGQFIMHRLDAPQTPLKSRYWVEPDQYLMSEAEYANYFPGLAYKNNDKIYKWKTTDKVVDLTVNTEEQTSIDLSKRGLPVGYYQLEFKTKDEAGNSISKISHLMLFDGEKRQYPPFKQSSVQLKERTLEPGEMMEVQLYNAANQALHFLVEIEFDNELVRSEWIKVKKWEEVKEKIEEKHRGGLRYQVISVYNDRFFNENGRVNVPWSNKELQIEYVSFRDKLKPGQEEEWQLKISGPKGEKVAAEMLVSMYDASLDAFKYHGWNFNPFSAYNSYNSLQWYSRGFTAFDGRSMADTYYPGYIYYRNTSYPSLQLFGLSYNYYGYGRVKQERAMMRSASPLNLETYSEEVEMMDQAAPTSAPPQPPIPIASAPAEYSGTGGMVTKKADTTAQFGTEEEAEKEADAPISPRTNLNETVFFFPDLKTNEEGDIIISFTMNEALTQWKFMGLTHTPELEYALTTKEVITQKELMILPNPPRFLREGDALTFTAKVTNLSEESLEGEAEIQLFDASTMEPIDATLLQSEAKLSFSLASEASAPVAWKLKVPEDFKSGIVYRVFARAGQYTDGEENAFPVLSNSLLVTETMPLSVRGNSNQSFELERIRNILASPSTKPYKVKMEITSNPSWLAIKSLPYLMEYPFECSEQLFHRYYANTLASSIANSTPKIKEVIDKWRDTPSEESELAKNQELKSVLLEESPWLLDAKDEEQQRKNLAILFDTERLEEESFNALAKLQERQSGNGGFVWFPGGRENVYITQMIVEGMGHLDQLGVNASGEVRFAEEMISRAIGFMDEKLLETYEQLEKRVEKGLTKFEDDNLGYLTMHYLYARSFYPEIEASREVENVQEYYVDQAVQYWTNKGIYQQGMLSIAMNRMRNTATAANVIKSLKERALRNDELGMYWKLGNGFYWYELPIETHSMMIEAFAEIEGKSELLDEMKIWLLKQKQTQHWPTTKSTASAIFALLNQGKGLSTVSTSWLADDELVKISFPKADKSAYKAKLEAAETNAEPGTGYYQVEWNEEEVTADLASIKIKNKNDVISWGGVYWQYFQNVDDITSFDENPLKLEKKLFKKVTSQEGDKLEAVTDNTTLKVGDRVVVRIVLRTDRDMDFVHMKDMRGSGMEPIDVISRYRWQDGLGYYQSTRDVATDFFFDYLRKGTYVFEYDLVVNHQGNYSSGITTIQSMYAPEFSSHSNSVRIKVN
ncbi:MAG: alpha-2-macroglobulin family protein [Bacteroidota bacterium]